MTATWSRRTLKHLYFSNTFLLAGRFISLKHGLVSPNPEKPFLFYKQIAHFFFESFLTRFMNPEHSGCFVGFYLRHECFLPFALVKWIIEEMMPYLVKMAQALPVSVKNELQAWRRHFLDAQQQHRMAHKEEEGRCWLG